MAAGSRIAQVHMRTRLHGCQIDRYFRNKQSSDEVESILLAYQAAKEIAVGHAKIADEHVGHMVALVAQMEWGNYTSDFNLREKITTVAEFVPPALRAKLLRSTEGLSAKDLFDHSKILKTFEENFTKEWKALQDDEPRTLGRTFNAIAKAWQHHGASLFRVKENTSGYSGWLAVHEDGIAVLSQDTLEEIDTISYENLVSFGFVGGALRLEKNSSKDSYLTFNVMGNAGPDCVYVISCYVNTLLRAAGVTSIYAKIKLLSANDSDKNQSSSSSIN